MVREKNVFLQTLPMNSTAAITRTIISSPKGFKAKMGIITLKPLRKKVCSKVALQLCYYS